MRNKLIGGLGLVLIVLLAGGFVYRRETALLTVKLGGFSPDGYGTTFTVQNNTERNISIRQGRVEKKPEPAGLISSRMPAVPGNPIPYC